MSEKLLHIVLGDSAAGSLKEACIKLGMPGNVFAIPDELSHGPLYDGRARAAYFKAQIYGHTPDVGIPDDVFGEWQVLARKIARGQYTAIVIWHSDAISDRIFLRMACWQLRNFAGTVIGVNTSEEKGWHGVGINGPEQLLAHFERRTVFNAEYRRALADEFEFVRDQRDLLRVYRDGAIASVGVDYFDAYVLSFVKPEWERAVRIIGNCLLHRMDENMIGDAFFEWRLHTLITARKLEAQGDLSRMHGYQVRLAADSHERL